MSFQVVRQQTYETYRFAVGDNVMLPFDGAPSDLSEARRTAIASLAHTKRRVHSGAPYS
jgi:hypothetical protein